MAEKRKSKRVYSFAFLFSIRSVAATVVPAQETAATVKETMDPVKKKQEKSERKPLQAVAVDGNRSGSLVGSKRKLSPFQSGNEENLCSNSMKVQVSSKKGRAIPKPKEHFLDTILASQNSLFGLQRKEEREASRRRVQQTKRTVFLDENLNSYKELEKLCGYSLTDSRISNALMEDIGLVLKPSRRRVHKMKRTVFLDENLNSFMELEQLCGYSLADSRISKALMEDIGLVLKP